MYIYIYICICICTCVCIYIYVYMCMCIFTHTYIHTCMHTYIHPSIHPYIHTYMAENRLLSHWIIAIHHSTPFKWQEWRVFQNFDILRNSNIDPPKWKSFPVGRGNPVTGRPTAAASGIVGRINLHLDTLRPRCPSFDAFCIRNQAFLGWCLL